MKWTLPICGVCLAGICGLARLGRAQNAPPAAAPTASTAPTSQPTPAPDAPLPHGMTPLFDGKTLAGWKQIPPDQWVVKDGAMVSLGKGRGVIATDGQFSNYRIIFDIRHVWAQPKKDHPACVLFFCTNPVANEKPPDMLAAVQFMIPQGFHWDYRPGKNNSGKEFFTSIVKSKADPMQWSRVELLVNAESGTARLAVAQPPAPPRPRSAGSRTRRRGRRGHSRFRCTTPGLWTNMPTSRSRKIRRSKI